MSTIVVRKIVGDGICVASEDGESVYNALSSAWNGGNAVTLSFNGVEIMTAAFLHAAVGRLYKDHSAEEVGRRLTTEGLDKFHENLLERVKDNAIAYYSDPEKFKESLRGILDDE